MKYRRSKFKQGKYCHPCRKPGNIGPWTRFRERFLNRNPLCVKCGRQANVVDHVVPLRYKSASLEDLIDVDNCQALCTDCHNAKSSLENQGGPKFCLCGFPLDDTGAACGKTECVEWVKGKFAWLGDRA